MKTTGRITRTLASAAAIAAMSAPALFAISSPAQAAPAATTKLLQSMAAEEKLAHDVYVTLGDQYGTRVFDNISASETTHLDRIRSLMKTYGVTDPTAGDPVGKFDDPAIQRLFNTLVARGKASLTAAASVGVTIEKLDIADIDKALATKPAADISSVLRSLRAGSERHLSAFQRFA